MSRASFDAIKSASRSTDSFKNWQLGVLKMNRQKDPAFEPAVGLIRATCCSFAFSGSKMISQSPFLVRQCLHLYR